MALYLRVPRGNIPRYADIPDPAERRLAVIRLHAQGWCVTSIGAQDDLSDPQTLG
jgi:hypothetical protein